MLLIVQILELQSEEGAERPSLYKATKSDELKAEERLGD